MKYLIVLVVILIFAWLLLRGRKRDIEARRDAPGSPAQAMVVCDHCGVHLPRTDAVEHRGGHYCSEAHRVAGPRPP